MAISGVIAHTARNEDGSLSLWIGQRNRPMPDPVGQAQLTIAAPITWRPTEGEPIWGGDTIVMIGRIERRYQRTSLTTLRENFS